MDSFAQKQLRVTMILGGTNQVFPGTNSNTLTLQGLRASAKIQAVARQSTQAQVTVWGMKRQDMDALTVAWANPPIVLNHLIIVEANSSGRPDGWSQVFKGTIIEAQPDYRAAPDVSFTASAVTGYFVKINPAPPTSYPETVDIGVAASDIIDAMGSPWIYKDGGATGVLTNPYFSGTLWDQLGQACAAANADYYVQGDEILITPAGQPGKDKPSIVLSPDSGLMGYPMFERSGLNVLALWNAAFLCGTPVDIESSVPNASGRWYPYSLSFVLEANLPRGNWLANLQCLKVMQ